MNKELDSVVGWREFSLFEISMLREPVRSGNVLSLALTVMADPEPNGIGDVTLSRNFTGEGHT